MSYSVSGTMKDIVVQKVPYFETSNNYDGVTVYIAEEVNQNA